MKASEFTNLVKDDFKEYGYELPEDYIHRGDRFKITVHDILKNKDNQMSYKDLVKIIRQGKRQKYTPPPPTEQAIQDNDEFPLQDTYAYENAPQLSVLDKIHRNTSDNLKSKNYFKITIDHNLDVRGQLQMFLKAVQEVGPTLTS